MNRLVVVVLLLISVWVGLANTASAQIEPTNNEESYLDTDNYMACQIVEDVVWEGILEGQEPFAYVTCIEIDEGIQLSQWETEEVCHGTDDVSWCVNQVEYEPGLSYLFIPKDELIVREEVHSHFVPLRNALIPAVERWRPLVEIYFRPEHVNRALGMIHCESTGNPEAKNPGSSASGLCQHLASLWDERSVKAGWAGADIFDPEANIAVAAWLVYQGGGWSHWNETRSCWIGY